MNNTIKLGLIASRHEMPVNGYIFDSVDNVMDFDAIKKHINEFIATHCNVTLKPYVHICNGYDNGEAYTAEKSLVVYVTGLTSVTAALIGCCAENGVNLTLMHYNREEDNYVPQIIFNQF